MLFIDTLENARCIHSVKWSWHLHCQWGCWSAAAAAASRFSRVRLRATPETATHQAPPSLGFSRQEHWSGLSFPSPGLLVYTYVSQKRDFLPHLSNLWEWIASKWWQPKFYFDVHLYRTDSPASSKMYLSFIWVSKGVSHMFMNNTIMNFP